MKTTKQIQDKIGEAMDNAGKFPGMSYTDGVVAALEWAMGGNEAVDPMED